MTGTSTALAAGTARTPSQRARRERILDAAIELAARGGYDAVQMREVAERADVALGTLYRYFPSKVHLLVSALARQLAALGDNVAARPVPGDDACERVLFVLARVMESLARSPRISEAMVRALMFADATVAADVDRVTVLTTAIISRAIHGDDTPPTEEDAAVAGVIGKVWLSDLVSWLGQRMTLDEMRADLEVTVRLVLPGPGRARRARR